MEKGTKGLFKASVETLTALLFNSLFSKNLSHLAINRASSKSLYFWKKYKFTDFTEDGLQ